MPCMLSSGIAEDLDAIEHIQSRLCPGRVEPASPLFALEQVGKKLSVTALPWLLSQRLMEG